MGEEEEVPEPLLNTAEIPLLVWELQHVPSAHPAAAPGPACLPLIQEPPPLQCTALRTRASPPVAVLLGPSRMERLVNPGRPEAPGAAERCLMTHSAAGPRKSPVGTLPLGCGWPLFGAKDKNSARVCFV